MKDFIFSWIVMQLVVIGLIGSFVHNEIAAKRFECSENKPSSMLTAAAAGIVFPLIQFTNGSVDREIEVYCQQLKQ